MAITGKFVADFASFEAAVQKAEVTLTGFQGNADKVGVSLNKMANSLNGTKIIQDATLMATAVEKIGGVAKLTETELQRLGAQAQDAIDKMKAMGIGVPENLQRIADAAKDANDATKGWLSSLRDLGNSWVARVAEGILLRDAIREVISVVKDGILAFPDMVAHTIEVGNSLYEMSLKTGASVENLSALRFVASQTGIDFNSFGNILFKMEQALGAQGNKAAELQGHLDKLHLSLKTLKDEKPDQAFIDIMSALEQVTNRADQAAAGMAIFGKGFKEMAGLTQESITELIDRAKELGLVMSTDQAAAAHAAEVSWKAFTMQLEAAEMAIASKVLPALVTLEQLASEAFKAFVDGSKDLTHAFDQSNVDARIIAIGEAIIVDTAAMAGFVQGAIEGLALVSHEAALIVGEFANVGAALIKIASLGTASENSKAFGGGPSASAQALKGLHDLYDATAVLDKGFQEAAKGVSSIFANVETMADSMTGKFKEAFEKARATIDDFAAKSHDAFGGVGDDVAMASDKTKGSIKALSEYWDEYNAAVASAAGDTTDKQIAEADKWRDKMIADLDKVSAKDADYVQKLGLVWATYYAKLDAIDLVSTEKRIEGFRTLGLAAETFVDKAQGGQQTLKLMAETMGDLDLPANTFINSLVVIGDRTRDAHDRMRDLKTAADELSFKNFQQSLSGLTQAFSELAQISGTALGSIFKSIGSVIGSINLAATAMDTLSKSTTKSFLEMTTSAISYVAALLQIKDTLLQIIPTTGDLTRTTQVQNFQNLSQFIQSLGLSAQEFFEKAKKAGIDLQQVLGDSHNAQKFAADLEMIKKKFEEIDAAAKHTADLLAEASSKYGPSQSDLDATEKHLHELFDAMVTAGTYSADQLNAAYYAWQKAMADAGNVAAQAWVKAHDAADAASAKANDAISKLQSQYDQLNQSVSQEAPEAEMGVIEKQQRAEMDHLKDQITQAQASADAQATAAGDAQKSWEDKMRTAGDTVTERFDVASSDMRDSFVAAASDAASGIKDEFDFTIHIPIAFDNPGLPVVPMASGGTGTVTRPTLFLAGERGPEQYAFSGANRSFSTNTTNRSVSQQNPVSIVLNISGVLDQGGLETVVQHQVLPLIINALDHNIAGNRTGMQEVLGLA